MAKNLLRTSAVGHRVFMTARPQHWTPRPVRHQMTADKKRPEGTVRDRHRNHRDAQGRLAPRALSVHRLRDQRARPLQRLDRRAHDEQGPGPQRLRLWPCRGGVFLELRALPGPRQPDFAQNRCPRLAVGHHGGLGAGLGRHGFGHRRDQLRHRPLPAGHGGGRLLPRRRLVHDLLVPRPVPRPHDGVLLRRQCHGQRHRRAPLGQSAAA